MSTLCGEKHIGETFPFKLFLLSDMATQSSFSLNVERRPNKQRVRLAVAIHVLSTVKIVPLLFSAVCYYCYYNMSPLFIDLYYAQQRLILTQTCVAPLTTLFFQVNWTEKQ
jgi:hypothetical protein